MSQSLNEEVGKRIRRVRRRKRAQEEFASSVLSTKMRLVRTTEDEKENGKREQKED